MAQSKSLSSEMFIPGAFRLNREIIGIEAEETFVNTSIFFSA
jgi:hypothetical protein